MDISASPRTRRSHPSLHHLSLNPLTSSSSIPPTPSSPTLAPTAVSSYISPATTLPPTYPSILSRSSSRTKLRSPGPTPVIDTLQNKNNNNNHKSRPGSRHHSRRGTSTETTTGYDADSSWLTRTASTLALHSLEERGQSWLASRNSATSLHHRRRSSEELEDYLDNDDDNTANGAALDASSRLDVKPPGYSRSTPGSRFASRVPSRVGSRASSRVDLRMTATMISSTPSRGDGSRDTLPAEVQAMADLEPDFVDLDEWDREEGGEVVAVMDEGEMRKLVLGRVGGWVDWMVGWMDLRGLGEEDGDEGMDEKVDEAEEKGQEGWRPSDREDVDGGSGLPAPGPGGGAWEDAKWLLSIAMDSL